MTFENWQTQPVSLERLSDEADAVGRWGYGVFAFLQNIGVVPWHVKTAPAQKVLLGLDISNIPAGYLASAAYEWDTWGPSQPRDFVRALEAELHPEKRDFIAALLTTLGRAVK